MKKLFYVLAIGFLISGCSFLSEKTKHTVFMEKTPINESNVLDSFLTNKEEKSVEKQIIKDQGIGITEKERADLFREEQNNYAFTMLLAEEQEIYLEILYALNNQKREMEISAKNPEEIDKVFQCVLIDHPEIFYTDGYSFVKYTLGNEVRRIIFEPNYIYDTEEIEKRKLALEEESAKLLEEIPEYADDYEKVKMVYELVIKNTEYSKAAEDNQNICSVFLGKASVCQGYAKAIQYLLNQLSIPATLVMGSVEDGEGHAWNLVKIEDQYYHVDATWGDASYLLEKEEDRLNHVPRINYDYLCITTEEIERTHLINHLISLPECTSREANYYVKEGAFFVEFNEGQLIELIQRSREQGKDSFTVKCKDIEVYNEISYLLLDRQEIFSYFDTESSSIIYSDSKEQLTLTFWLV